MDDIDEELLIFGRGEWEKREKDSALFEQLDLLFKANDFLPRAEENKARLRKRISQEWVIPGTLECTISDRSIRFLNIGNFYRKLTQRMEGDICLNQSKR